MFALRETWKDVFLPTKLYMIDVKVNQLDPNWPIVAKVTKNPKIHVNPNFLKKVRSQCECFLLLLVNGKLTCITSSSLPLFKQIEPIDPIEQLKQEVLEKQRKLIELQQCKLELEMRETNKKIEEEEKRRAMDSAGAIPSVSYLI